MAWVAVLVVVAAAALAASGPAAPVARMAPVSAAGVELSRLADAIGQSPADLTRGRYFYRRQWRWITTLAPRTGDLRVYAACLELWVAEEGDGATSQVAPPPTGDLASTAPDYRSIGAEFAGITPQKTIFSAGTYNGFVDGWVPAEPVALIRYLASEPLPDAPDTTLSAVAHLYLTQYLNRAARAAVLRLLAQTPALTWHPRLVDRMGRRGVGVSADLRTGRRRTLIFDPATGQLLASQTVKARPDNELRALPIGHVTFYTLLGEVGRRAQLP